MLQLESASTVGSMESTDHEKRCLAAASLEVVQRVAFLALPCRVVPHVGVSPVGVTRRQPLLPLTPVPRSTCRVGCRPTAAIPCFVDCFRSWWSCTGNDKCKPLRVPVQQPATVAVAVAVELPVTALAPLLAWWQQVQAERCQHKARQHRQRHRATAPCKFCSHSRLCW